MVSDRDQPTKAASSRPTNARRVMPPSATAIGRSDRPDADQSAITRGSPRMSLFDTTGTRKYLTIAERTVFLRAAERADRQVRTLCMTLAYAGCRLSEALALTTYRVDLSAGVLVFETLKKRRSGVYRAVPVHHVLLEALDLVHGIRELQPRRGFRRCS